ncbi:2,4-dienoyl-CoA reductase-like protein [Trypanosoma conorhini]|uniref:2,4-dienoyl-CoA reductase-like protein n=1 Tax=Trypanosoma conorhini TaxID=83891 RepID=A0A422PA72_9TRYP|nr:2,4-dienoyl-CoA reductase-like protein [Trypanosoma conorhini]RNF14621.1 2,4-dienoyl-CoA reductase-like protein [Trypanosoma conorhini]
MSCNAGGSNLSGNDLVDWLDVLPFYAFDFQAETSRPPPGGSGSPGAAPHSSSSSSSSGTPDAFTWERDAACVPLSVQLGAGAGPGEPLPLCRPSTALQLRGPRSPTGRVTATLHRSNSVDVYGRVVTRHSITSHPRPGLRVEIPEDNPEEYHLELATLLQQKQSGRNSLRGPEVVLSAGNCGGGEEGSGSRSQSVTLLLPPSITHTRGSLGAEDALPSDPPLGTSRQLLGAESREKYQPCTTPSHRDSPDARALAAKAVKTSSYSVAPVVRVRGVAERKRVAGGARPRHEKPHNGNSTINTSRKGKENPPQGSCISRLFCMS